MSETKEGKHEHEHVPANADEALLASLGYKQEFQRAFTGLEVSSFDPKWRAP